MNPEQVQPRSWPRRLRLLVVALILVLQLGLIWWLSDSRPLVRHPAPPATVLRLAGPGPNWVSLLDPSLFNRSGNNGAQITNFTWLTLVDPTLFGRPHEQTFSGPAWMAASSPEFPPLSWAEPAEWLELPAAELGAAFHEFLASRPFTAEQRWSQAEPQLALPALPPARVFPEKSLLRLGGELAARELMTRPDLPSWASTDILSNSIVQVLVDADGRPVSATLLPPGSGLRKADEHALEVARSARFGPLPNSDPDRPMTGMSFVQMIFTWYTLQVAKTNTPPN